MLMMLFVCWLSYIMRIITPHEKDVKSLDEICDEFRMELYKNEKADHCSCCNGFFWRTG